MRKFTLSIIVALVSLVVSINFTQAGVPRLLSYQGILTDKVGDPVTDGNYTIIVRLYDVGTGGVALFEETLSIQSVGGTFNTTIGKSTQLTLDFDKQYYLGITLQGQPEFAPRTSLVAVPYSLQAENAVSADGLKAGAFGAVTSLNGAAGDLQISGNGATTIARTGNVITITTPEGIKTINSEDNSLVVTNPTGPTTTLKVGNIGLRNISPGGAASGDIIKFDGIEWKSGKETVYSAGNGITIQGQIIGLAPQNATNGQVLKWNGAAWVPGTDDNSSYTAGSGLQLTANQFSVLPAGGDLSGAHTNATVAGMLGRKIAPTNVANGQALVYNSTANSWQPSNIDPDPNDDILIGSKAGGDFTGTYPNPAVADGAITSQKLGLGAVTMDKIADAQVTSAKINPIGATTGQALTFDGTSVVWGNQLLSGVAGGDLSGTYPNPSVGNNVITTAKLADGSVTTAKLSSAGASNGQALTFNGTNVTWGNPSLSGSAGGDLTGAYPNPAVANDAITTAKLADNSITTSKVNDGAITSSKLADNSVTTTKVIDGSITTSKVNTTGATNGQALTFNGTNVVWGNPAVSGAAGGDLTGTYPNPTVAANAITSAKLADNSVTTTKVTDGSITTSKVSTTGATNGQALTFNGTNVVWGNPAVSGNAGGDLTGTYPNPTVASNAITNAKLADNSVTTSKVTDGSITTSKVNTTGAASGQALTFNGTNVVWGSPSPSGSAGGDLTGTYPNPAVASNAITSSKLADNSVTTSKVTDGSITTSKVNTTGAASGQALTFNGTNVVWGSPSPSGSAGGDLAGTYPNPTVTANAITNAKLADNSVTTTKVTDGSITTSKVSTTGATSGQALTFNGTNVVWGNPAVSGAAGGDLSGTYPNPTVASNAITTAKLADNSVTTTKVTDGSITTSKVSTTGATSGQALTFNGTNVVWGNPAVSGAAGGDLTGTYPNPTVAANAITSAKLADNSVTTTKVTDGSITTSKVSTTGATNGQALTFNGTNVVWGNPAVSGNAGGDLTGTYPNPAVALNAITSAKLADNSVTTSKVTDGSITTSKVSTTGAASGQALTFNGTNVVWGNPAVSGAAGGDLTGTYPSPTITANAITSAKLADNSVTTTKVIDGSITTSKVNTTGATNGQALTFNGTNAVWGNPAVSGAAGGDLSGTYPNPTVASNAITTVKLADNSVTTTKVTDGAITPAKVNSSGATYGQALTFDGTNVVWGSPSPSGSAGGDLTGTYPSPTITANAITSVKLADNSVTTTKVTDGAITPSKVNSSGATNGQALTFDGTNVVWSSPLVSGAASGDLTGNYPNPTITANAVTTSKILDGNVTTSKLADGSVTTAKVSNGSITPSKVNSSGATNGQALTFDGTNVVWGSPSPSGIAGGDLAGTYPNPTVAANAITNAKLADNSVTTSKVNDGAITNAKLADNSVTTTKVNDGSITTSKVSTTGATNGQALTFNGTNVVWGNPAVSGNAGGDLTGTYPNPAVASNAITSSKLADNSVTTSKVTDGSITTSKVNTTGATSGQALTFNGTNVVWGNPAASGAAGGDLSGTYPNPTVASNAITTVKLADNSVTTSKVTDGSITTSKVNTTGATSGQALTFNGTNVVWGSPSPSGSAGGDLAGTYPNPTVASNAITSAKLADNSVTTTKVTDGSITTSKVSTTGAASGQALTFNGTNVVWGNPAVSGAAGGDLTGTYPNPTVASNAITSSKLADNSVTTTKVIDGSITTSKVNTTGATSGQALTFNGTNAVWGNPAVSGAAGGDLSGTYPNPTVASNAITTVKLADNSVTTTKVTDGAITPAKVNSSGATYGQALTFDGTNVVWSSPSVSGSASGDLTGNYPNPTITANAVTTSKILDGNVTTSKLADGSVTTIKVNDGAITPSKVNSSGATNGQALTFDGTNVVWSSPSVSGAASGDLTGNYPNPTITANAVTTSKILDGNVTTSKLADGSVTTIKVNDGAITPSKVNSSGATNGQALTFDGTNVVWSSPSVSGAASGDLTGNYPNPTITANAVTTSKILDGNVTTSKLADGSVTTIKVNDGAITPAKVNSSGATNGQALTFDGTNVVWSSPSVSGAASGDLTGNYPNPSITANAVTTSKILDGNVTTSKLADGSVTTIKVNDGAITPAKVNSSGATNGQALTFDGTNVVWSSPSVSGAASGDLTGNYPNPQIAAGAIVNADINAAAAITYSKLSLGNSIVAGDIVDGTIANADINAGAAIAYSKLSLTNSIVGGDIATGTFSTTNTHYALGNNDNTARELRLIEPSASGTNYTAFKAQAQAANITYTLPNADGTSGQTLSTNGSGTLSWTTASASGAAGGDLSGTYPNPQIAAGAIVNADINAAAAITYSKLSLGNSIVTGDIVDGTVTNADINTAAAIAYSKLSLTNSIVGGDIASGTFSTTNAHYGIGNNDNTARELRLIEPSSSGTNYTAFKAQAQAANITYTLPNADGTSGQTLSTNGSGTLSWTTASASGAAGGDLSGTYPNPQIAAGAIVNADINGAAAITYSKLSLGNSIVAGDIVDGTITNADINGAAAIAYSKLSLTNSIVGGDIASGTFSTTNAHYGIGNNDNTARELRLIEPSSSGTNYTAFKSQAQAADITYTLPNADGTSGQTLSTNGSGVLSWTTASAGGAAGGDLSGTYPNPQIGAGAIVNADINAAAAISYSKLSLGSSIVTGDIVDGTITNADINAGAAIAYSKLSLTSSIVGGDIATGTFSTTNTHYALGNNDNTARELRLIEPNGSGVNYTAFKAQAQAADVTYTLPNADGTSGQTLSTNGSGVLSWTTASAGGAAGGDLSGTYPNPQIAAGAIVNADINVGAAISYSKLSLSNSIVTGDIVDGTIVNADINAAAAIAYSKLNLTNSIVGGDIASGTFTTTNAHHAISNNDNTARELRFAEPSGSGVNYTAFKAQAQGADVTYTLPSSDGTNGQILSTNGSGTLSWTTASASGAAGGDLSGTYPNPQIASGAIVNADINAAAAIAYSKLSLGNSIVTGDIVDGTITNADINAGAAIAYSKLNLTNSIVGGDIASGTFTTTNAHHAISNNDNTARELRFAEPSGSGTNYTAFKAGTQGADITYTLPTTVPSNGQVLSSTSAGVLSWTTAGGLSNFTESVNTSAPNATVPVVQLLATNGATNVDIALTPKGAGSLTAQIADNISSGGNKRGVQAIDWQMVRAAASQVASSDNSTLSGGANNTVSGQYGVVAGGYGNIASGSASAIGGGYQNTSSNTYSTVSGGTLNQATALSASVGGGSTNTASGSISTVGGGLSNVASGNFSTIAGGNLNTTSNEYSVAGGGQSNTAGGQFSVIAGGKSNTASGNYSTVAGGNTNSSTALNSTVSGGSTNTADGIDAIVGGGEGNTSSGFAAIVQGGYSNSALGDYSSILGGRSLTFDASADYSLGYLANAGSNSMTISAPNTTVFGNTNIWLANNTNAAKELRFYEANITASGAFPPAGINYTAFKAGVQSANITYTLPTADGTSGQILSTDGSGVLSWATASTSGSAGGDLSGTYPNPQIAAGTILNADINAGAAIAYSKLSLGSSIVTGDITDGTIANADINSAAAIAYSKLNLTSSIVGGDIASGTFTTTNAHHAIGNNDNTARELRFSEPSSSGTNYTAFRAAAQAADVTYTLPTADGTSGQTLSTNGSGTLSWATASSTVTTGSSLTGNGSGGSPLGINLANSNTWTANQTFGGTFLITSNSRIAMTNSDNNARDLRLQEPSGTGTQYIGIRSPSVTNNGNYLWAASVGSVGQVLQISSTNGVDSASLSWGTVTASLANFTESVNTSSPNATVPVVRLLATNGATNVDIALSPKGTGALTAEVADGTVAGGNKRGSYAVDWQTVRLIAADVASGLNSVIGGGEHNLASGGYSTVAGGYGGSASAANATVGGGNQNQASNSYATVGGGDGNVGSGDGSTVGGGSGNTASGSGSVVCGGSGNTVAGTYSTVLGGRNFSFGTNGYRSIGFNGNTDTDSRDITIDTANTAVLNNVNLWLSNNDNKPRTLRFYEQYNTAGAFPGSTNYVAFSAPNSISSNQIYYLPSAYPSSDGRPLTSTTTGTTSWGLRSIQVLNQNVNCGNLAANGGTAFVELATITGAAIGSTVTVSPRGDMENGVIIAGAYISAANTVRIKFVNATAGAIDPAAVNFDITVVQP